MDSNFVFEAAGKEIMERFNKISNSNLSWDSLTDFTSFSYGVIAGLRVVGIEWKTREKLNEIINVRFDELLDMIKEKEGF